LGVNKSMTLSVVFPQVAAMPGLWYRTTANGLEAVCSGADLRSNFAWAFLIGSEFTMFVCVSYSFHMIENKVACLNGLQSNCGRKGVRCGACKWLPEGELRYGWRERGTAPLGVLHCSALPELSTDECGE